MKIKFKQVKFIAYMVFVPILTVLLGIADVSAQMPDAVDSQGRLLKNNQPVSGTMTLTFAIFDQPSDGNLMYTSTESVMVVDGLYTLHIPVNSSDPALAIALNAGCAYLEVTAGKNTLSPRTLLTVVTCSLTITYDDPNGTPAAGTGSTPLLTSGRSSTSDTTTSTSTTKSSSKTVAADTMAAAAAAAAVPTVTAVSPNLGDTYGGVPITLTGTGFTGTTGVTVGGTACTSVSVVSDTSITCVAPAKTAAKYYVNVTTSGGTSANSVQYESWSPLQLSPKVRLFQSDQGITAATTTTYGQWDQVCTNMGSAFTVRDGAQLLYLNGSLYLLGGWNPDPAVMPNETCNEVWKSTNLGKTWTRLLAGNDTLAYNSTTRWRRRHMAGCVVHNNLLYVIGGDLQDTIPYNANAKWPHHPNDVWSSPDGKTWTRRTLNAQWGDNVNGPARGHHMVASFKGKLYLMGGHSNPADGTTALNDVWESSDGGANWVRKMAHNPNPGTTRWMPRGMLTNPVEFNGKLWVIGGGTYDEPGGTRTFYNDVWTWDGVSANWTQVLANGVAPWAGREYHNVLVHDNKLWVLGGFNYSGNLGDVWWSSDGITWNEVKHVPWTPTHGGGFAAGGGYIFHAAGNGGIVEPVFDADGNIVSVGTKYAWRMSAKTGGQVSRWNDMGADLKHLYQPTVDDRPFRMANEFGAQPGIQMFGWHFLSLSPAAFNPDPVTWLDPSYGSYKDQGNASGTFQVYVVGKADTFATNLVSYVDFANPPNTLVGTADGGDSLPWNEFGLKSGVMQYVDGQSGWQKVDGGSALADGQSRLIWAQHKEGSLKLGVGTSTKKTVTTVGFNTDYTGWQELGCGFSFADKAKFTYGAVVIIPDVAVSSAGLTNLNKWARKWGNVAN
jgi:hypothetical protein